MNIRKGEGKLKFFIYSRKSVYTGKGESIENQIEMCRQYIATKFADDLERKVKIYEDEGFSAKNTDRPQFQRMLRDIREEKPDFVVCYRLDRISRSVSDFSSLIEEWNGRGIAFVCIKEEFDTSKPMGKAMMYIASVFAQLERETIAERVRDNMRMLARTGRWLGGATPTGYTSEKKRELVLDGKVKTSCKLRDDPGELAVVDAIYQKFLELRSVSGVGKYLARQGIRSRGGQLFSLLGIKEILQNPVYCTAGRDALDYFTKRGAEVCFSEADCASGYGLLAYNKRDYKKKNAPRQPVDRWIVAVGRHRGRIPGKQWVEVQRILADNVPTGQKPAKMHNDYALLSGLLVCGRCGSRMFAKRRTGKNADSEQFDYLCGAKLRGGAGLCACPNIGGRATDEMVSAFLSRYACGSAGILPLLECCGRDMGSSARGGPLDARGARLQKCGEELDRLVRALSQGQFDAMFVRRVNARAGELERECAALEAERLDAARADGQAAEMERLAGALSGPEALWKELTLPEKRALVKRLVQKLVWDGTDLQLYWNAG